MRVLGRHAAAYEGVRYEATKGRRRPRGVRHACVAGAADGGRPTGEGNGGVTGLQ